MTGISAGMLCIKTRGRESGQPAVILEFDKAKGIAIIYGPKVRKRRCSIRHLFPIGKTIEVKGLSKEKLDIEILNAIKPEK